MFQTKSKAGAQLSLLLYFYPRCDDCFKILRFQLKSETGTKLSLYMHFYTRCDDFFYIHRFQTKSEAASTLYLNAVVVILLYLIK